ncbi:hypothetical protein BgiBS90_023263, partial [Biomphalaria glabrata]
FRTTSVADSSLSVSTKPNILSNEDYQTYEDIEEPSSLVVYCNTAGKSDIYIKKSVSTFDSSDTETLVADSCFSFGTNNVRNPS